MAAGHAEPAGAAPPPRHEGRCTPWASLTRRQVAELTLPGVAIGVLTGGILGTLVMAGGESFDVALVTGLTLAVPLSVAGAGYEILIAKGRVPLGVLTPVALYFAVAFTLARVFQTAVLALYAGSDVAVPHGWLDFVTYQALVSVGFGIGYWWLHENFAPLWWVRIRRRNPVAEHLLAVKLQHADSAQAERERRRRRR